MKPLLLASLLLLSGPALAEQPDPQATWSGAIELPGAELAIAVTLERGHDGWSGAIDIPAQGLANFPLAEVAVDGGRVHFAMDGIPGRPTFEGELDAEGKTIDGSFTQGPQSFPFTLRRAEGEETAGQDRAARIVPGELPPGEWLGALEVGPMQLRLVLRIDREADPPTATLDSVDQEAVLTVDTLTFAERTLRFTIDGLAVSFTGILSEDGDSVTGTWTQGERTLPLVFRRLGEPFALERPQNPRPPFPYESREITFRNAAAGIDLAGTLLVPEGEGPFPTVLFVTGSGPQDRDESLMGHKPFLVVADDLARRGIASLRYDDRGVGDSEGDFATATLADLTSDAAAGVAYLAAQPDLFDRDAIGIVGHSEGGLSAPQVAISDPEVDFLVLLAPPGERLDSLVLRQTRTLFAQQGIETDLIDRAMASQAEVLELLADESLGTDEVVASLRARADLRNERFTAVERARVGLDEASVERGIAQGTTPWFRSLLREDPATHLARIRIPVLALFAEKDVQVDAEVNAAIVEAALSAAGNEDFDVRILPGLNHLFQPSETGAPAEYGTIEETFAPQALDIVGGWIVERFAAGPPAAADDGLPPDRAGGTP